MYLWSEIQRDSPLLASDLIVEELEKALLTSLLLAADDAPHPDHRTLPLAYLRRAVDFILAHLSEPQSLGDIAAVAGVHGRTLQKAFRKHYGVGVMEFVQRNRLDQVHRELLALDPTQTTVTSVAVAGGFLHLGRFAAAYRHQFGEFPTETLRRYLAPPPWI